MGNILTVKSKITGNRVITVFKGKAECPYCSAIAMNIDSWTNHSGTMCQKCKQYFFIEWPCKTVEVNNDYDEEPTMRTLPITYGEGLTNTKE